MARMLGRYRHLMRCKNPQCSYCAAGGAARWRKRVEQQRGGLRARLRQETDLRQHGMGAAT